MKRSLRKMISVGVFGAFLLVLLPLLSVSTLPSVSAAPPTQSSFILDGITVIVNSDFLPSTRFITSRPSDSNQVATSTQWKPFRELSFLAVPYGTKPGVEIVPVARAGGSVEYVSALRKYWQSSGATIESGPPALLFGQSVVGQVVHTNLILSDGQRKPALLIEWVVDAGQRLWVVRATREIDTNLSQQDFDSLINQMRGMSSSSDSLQAPTSVKPDLSSVPKSSQNPESVNDLSFPSWWNGQDCDHDHYYSGSGGWNSFRLGATFQGMPACGPRPIAGGPDVLVRFFSGAWGEYEWECVELVMRYMYLAFGISPYGANGKDVVWNYSGSILQKISNGTANSAPQPGDVLSYGSNTTYGHASVVMSSSVDGSGNGNITVVEQNNSSGGALTMSVSNWTVNGSPYSVSGWLHKPGGGGGSGGPAGYTFCANENQRCNFSGTKDVAYGANGSFNYKYNITGGIDCNNGTFGDPISGVGKACYTKDSSQIGCNPNPDQVALFEHGGYNGNCKVFNKADYPNPGAMGFANDTASSIKVGGNVKATLCKDDNYGGGCEDFSGDDGNLGDNSIGDNQVSSLKVQDRGSSGGNGVEFCDGTNYGSPCITLTAGKYGNLNDIGWYDRIESLRFKGNYVGNYHVVMSTETGHGGTPGHFEKDEPNLQDPWRNRTRSIEIYYIDRNNPPGTPSLSSPGDWYESNDGTAPNLCWNASSDPEGDNPVQYYTEVFDSAVNGNSGWTTNTCWRPSNLDNQYFGYQWRVKARDNKNKESGWSETRHFTIRQPAPQKPDLRPATLSGYPAPLVPSSIQGTHQTNTLFANARTFIDWHFSNAGNGVASGNFYVDVYFDDQRVVHYPYSDFGAGGIGGFDDWAATFNATGVHKLKIVTDPDNAVQESDENNNVWEQQFTWVAINGWRGEYFKNATLDSNPWLTRDDANIDFDWAGGSPDPSLPVDNFSARWMRAAAFECGRYRFNVRVDDGVRLWVNNQKILDEWRDQVAEFHPEVDLTAGALPIQVEYYEGGGGAAIQVNWQKLSSCVTKPPAPTLNNPGNGSNNPYNYDLTFQWNAASGASEYLVEWWGGPYSTMQPCGWSSNTSCHIGTVAAGNTYSWHVKARNSAGESGWSDTRTFTIQTQPQPPSAPHDPDPANGASLSYRTALDVSVQGEGEQFRIHVWGNNYDRWRDWDASRSLHLDGLTNQTYNFQAQARNSAGASPWSAVWTFTIQPAPSQQLVLNPGFEADDDGNGIPDNWGNNVKFMRVGTPRRSDSYAGRLSATDNKNVTITQQISNLAAGQTYNASCWVRIKKTADVFAFKVQVRWRDSANKILRTDVIGRTFTGKTVGWEQAARTMSAPTGTATAQFQFKATSLNAKIYLDDCSFMAQ